MAADHMQKWVHMLHAGVRTPGDKGLLDLRHEDL